MRFQIPMMVMAPDDPPLGGGGAPPPPGGGGAPPPSGFVLDKAVWGDITPEFPEGLEDTVKNEASLKPFFGKDNKPRVAEIIKSFVHTKKQQGADRVAVPKDDATPEQLEEFWSKAGWVKDAAGYKLALKKEESSLDEEFVTKFQTTAHKHHIPMKQAQKLLEDLDKQTAESITSEVKIKTEQQAKALDGIKQEWGSAFDTRVALAKRLLTDSGASKEDLEIFKNPEFGSNPALMRILFGAASKIYKEDTVNSNVMTGRLTPNEAAMAIAKIQNDPKHPYHSKSASGHAAAMLEMQELFKMKRGK